MKQLITCLAVVLVAFSLGAAEGEWMTDLAKAQTKAKEEKKLVLIDFTGSDWCPPCKKLHQDIFMSQEFKDYAAKNLVLVEIDFPRSKPQSDELKAANKQLSEKYNVTGFPTVIVLSPDGKELSREVGFGATTPEKYVAKLQKLKQS